MQPKKFIKTEYLEYRCETRGVDIAIIEHIIRYSTEL
jgi:hypothetical protein